MNINIDKLIKDIKENKSEKSFRKLYDKFKYSVFSHSYKIIKNPFIAEEVVSITFTKAFKNIDKYESKRYFITWLKTIARNETINYIRKEKKHFKNTSIENFKLLDGEENDYTPSFLIDKNLNPYQKIVEDDRKKEIRNSLNHLSDKNKELVEMKFLKELKINEISKIKNIPTGSVKSAVYRSLKDLKSVLEKKKKLMENLEIN